VYIYVYACKYIPIYIYTYKYLCVYVYVRTYEHIHAHVLITHIVYIFICTERELLKEVDEIERVGDVTVGSFCMLGLLTDQLEVLGTTLSFWPRSA